MRYPKILLSENEVRLSPSLRELAKARRWVYRECRRWEAVRDALLEGGPGVGVVRVGADLGRQARLVESMRALFPEIPVIVVMENADARCAGAFWDLGATLVVASPWTAPDLLAAAEVLLQRATPFAGNAASQAPEGQDERAAGAQ